MTKLTQRKIDFPSGVAVAAPATCLAIISTRMSSPAYASRDLDFLLVYVRACVVWSGAVFGNYSVMPMRLTALVVYHIIL